MAGWKTEDDLNAELRALTDELRRVREEQLHDTVFPPKPGRSRAFLQRQSCPAPVKTPRAVPGKTPR